VAIPSQERVGSYRLVNLLRKGQACEVWEVFRAGEDQRREAMKLLPRGSKYDREQINALKHEYAVGRQLDHPNVIKLTEYGTAREGAYVLMELFKAPNLKQRIHEGKETYLHHMETIVRGSAAALGHLHHQGWVHRDVKPDNFLVDDDGATKLIDFNLAIRRQGLLKRLLPGRNKVQGTMSYMSPEQIRGLPVDARADVYSFGCMLHEMIAGKPPYTGVSVHDLLTKHLRSQPPSLEPLDGNVHTSFAKLVQRMIAKDPAQRPESMEALLDELLMAPIFRERPKPPKPAKESS
jgi:serine/threonine protein kinase